jgi:5-methyltetrahydropteroyltriglutamate--homocysteine methyltransferase
MELLALLKGKDVLLGAIDVASHAIETPEEVADTIRRGSAYVAPEKLFPCTNCGMAPMPSHVAYAKLAALAEGAALMRKSI